ncbi:AzlC family protein [Streptococcus pneumoniae]|nr:AzlC family protein [Streptococcus pneumoniae]VMJ95154.1 AzlC family protein [Streptococcus pneumoniae]VOL59553.1 AzlC family protein [Streptococcus pneumoniae]VQC68347.1 AzlC family protein [Streptococcus pneumoniae]VQV16918.1 AzlC family protein [Streptococcus pneumoniae]
MPTALGYVSIGLACGTIGAPYVTPVEMGLMSLFVYAGSAQFAMLALIVVQAPVAAIAMTVFLINLRLFLLSLHASTYFRHTSLWYNIGMSSILTDETYGVLMGELAHTDKVNPMWMHGNNLNSYVAWFVGNGSGWPATKSRNLWLGFCPGWDVYWYFCFAISDYAKTDSCPQSAHYPSSCCGVLLFALDSGVSVTSCSVCDATWL